MDVNSAHERPVEDNRSIITSHHHQIKQSVYICGSDKNTNKHKIEEEEGKTELGDHQFLLHHKIFPIGIVSHFLLIHGCRPQQFLHHLYDSSGRQSVHVAIQNFCKNIAIISQRKE